MHIADGGSLEASDGGPIFVGSPRPRTVRLAGHNHSVASLGYRTNDSRAITRYGVYTAQLR